jgi:hypothetical protein
MRVRLPRKFADHIGQNVGNVLGLPDREASLLLAEDWVIPERRLQERVTQATHRESDHS